MRTILISVLAVLALISCESPVQAGLGEKVDINPPTLAVLEPAPGAYIHDDVTFKILAQDDIRVDTVSAYGALEEDFDPAKAEWVVIDPPAGGSSVWTWPRRTTNYEDGLFMVRFRAVDNTGKIVETEDLVYTIKNLPPRIDLQIPSFAIKDRKMMSPAEVDLIKGGLTIDTGTHLIGFASDIRGIDEGYPRIKFWREGSPQPDFWSAVDEPAQGSAAGVKSLEFRYYMRDHNSMKDPADGDVLEPGNYRLQVQIQDIDHYGIVFPPPYQMDGRECDYLPIRVTPSREQPKLTVSALSSVYQSEAFSIEAKATHSMGIARVDFRVRRFGDPLRHELPWEFEDTNDKDWDINDVPTRSRTVESYSILPGGFYPEKNGDSLEITSGTYEFEIIAIATGGSQFSQAMTVYIDNTPPTVAITNIDPAEQVDLTKLSSLQDTDPSAANYFADKPYFIGDQGHNILETRTVNGKVLINISSFDTNGLGVEPDSDPNVLEVRSLKYLLVDKGSLPFDKILPIDPSKGFDMTGNPLNPDRIYNNTDKPGSVSEPRQWTGFVDKLGSDKTQVLSSPSLDTLLLNTAKIFPDANAKGDLYLFIAAKDKAGNIAALTKGSAVIGYHLHVDQARDNPEIKLTDLRADIITRDNLPATVNVMGINARLRGTLLDDDGIIVNPNTVQFFLNRWDEAANGWAATGGIPDWKVLPLNSELLGKGQGRSLDFTFTRSDLGRAYASGKDLPDGVYRLYTVIKDAGKDVFPSGDLKNGDDHAQGGIPQAGAVVFAINGVGPRFDSLTPPANSYASTETQISVAISAAAGPLHLELITPHSVTIPTESWQFWDIDFLRTAKSLVKSNPNLTVVELFEGHISLEQLNKKLGDAGEPAVSTNTGAWNTNTGLINLKNLVINTVLPDILSVSPVTNGVDANGNRTASWTFAIQFDQDHLRVGLRAEDFFLAYMDDTVMYRLDLEPPVVEVKYPGNGEYFTGDDTIKGTTWDPNRNDQTAEGLANGVVENSYYWIGPVNKPAELPPAFYTPTHQINAAWKPVSATGLNRPIVNWNVPINAVTDAMDEGEYVIHFVALDQAGHVSYDPANPGLSNPRNQKSWKFGVDRTAPSVSETAIAGTGKGELSAADGEKDQVFSLKGQFWDTNGYKTLRIQQSADKGVGVPAGIEQVIDVSSFPKMISEVTKSTWEVRDLPWKEKLPNGDMVSYTPDELKDHHADGIYTYTITITDAADREKTITRRVFIDTRPPELTVTQPFSSLDEPAYFSTSSLSFMGNAYDAFPGAITKVFFYDCELVLNTFNGTWDLKRPPAPLDLNHPAYGDPNYSGTWPDWDSRGVTGTSVWRIEKQLANNAAEGERGLMILAVDSLGHQSTALVYGSNESPFFPYAYDKAPPQLTETAIGTVNTYLTASKFNLAGRFGDTNAVRSLVITQTADDAEHNCEIVVFDAAGASYTTPSYTPPLKGLDKPWDTNQLKDNGGNGGNIRFPLKISAVQPAAGIAYIQTVTGSDTRYIYHDDSRSGIFNYTITVTDSSGRQTKVERTVNVDITPPYITLDSGQPDDKWYDANVNIRGAASDGDSGIAAIYYWYGPATGPGSAPPNSATLADLEHNWSVAAGTANWSVPLNLSDSAFAEGRYTLYVIPVDIAGNLGGRAAGSPPVMAIPRSPLEYHFNVDKAPPTLVENPVHPGFAKGAFTLSLDLDDTYSLNNLRVEQSKDGDGFAQILDHALTGLTTKTQVLTGLPWTSLGASALADDGAYTYRITLTDTAGKTAELTKTVLIDKTPPQVNIQRPAEGEQVTGTTEILITGTAFDEAPGSVTQVFYWLGLGDETPPVYPDGTWTSVYTGGTPGIINWSKSIAVGNAQGKRKIAVIGVDQLGNQSVPLGTADAALPGYDASWIGVRTFWVDRDPPTMAETTLGPSVERKFVNPNFTLGGYAQDSYAIDKITLIQTWTGAGTPPAGVSSPITVTLQLNTADTYKAQQQTWSFTGLPYKDAVGGQTGSGTAFTFAGTNQYSGDGEFNYTITASDLSGRYVTELRSVTLDVTPPTVALDAAFAQNAWFHGDTLIRGTADDAAGTVHSGIGAVYYWIGLQTDTPPTTPPAGFNAAQWKTTSGFDNWQVGLDLSQAPFAAHNGQGLYRLLVLAKDAAGNYSSTGTGTDGWNGTRLISYPFGIDTAPPELTETALSSDTYQINAFTLGGTFTDSYALSTYQITQQALSGGGPVIIKPYGTDWDNGNPTTTYNWTIGNLPKDPADPAAATPYLHDDEYTYVITVRDRSGQTRSLTRVITLDTMPPTAAISVPDADGFVTAPAAVLLQGTANDTAPGKVDKVYYWIGKYTGSTAPAIPAPFTGGYTSGTLINGWAEAELSAATGSWSWSKTVDLSGTGEGQYRLAAIALDKAGRLSAVNAGALATRDFWVDTAPPTLTETELNLVNPPARNTAFTLKGTARDTNGLGSIKITQQKTGLSGVDVILDTTSFTGDGVSADAAWELGGVQLPRGIGNNTVLDLLDGTYTYVITLTDKAGRTTTVQRVINLDISAPQTSGGVSDITVEAPLLPVGSIYNWQSGATITVKGTVNDAIPAPNPAGSIVSPSGIKRVFYVATEESVSEPSNASDWQDATLNGNSWSGPLALAALPEGVNKLWVKAEDYAGNSSVAYTRLFGVDNNPPSVTAVIPSGKFSVTPEPWVADVQYSEGDRFTLNGSASDNNRVAKVVVTQQYNQSGSAPGVVAVVNEFDLSSTPTTTGAWSFPAGYLPRDPGNTANPMDITSVDGVFVYTITAYDIAGKAASVTRRIAIDMYGPTVQVIVPAPPPIAAPTQYSIYQGTTLRISGNAVDNSGVSVVRYLILSGSDAVADKNTQIAGLRVNNALSGPPVYVYPGAGETNDRGWLEAEGGAAWSKTIEFNTLSPPIVEGRIRLWAVARDTAGRWGDPVNVDFDLDQNPPVINNFAFAAANISTTASANYARGNFSFHFEARDSNKLLGVKTTPWTPAIPSAVKIERYDGTVTTLLTDTNADNGISISNGSGTGDSVQVVVNQKAGDGADQLRDGTYTYTMTITDTVGKTVILEKTVVVDRTPPGVFVTNLSPIVDENSVNGIISFSITASDENGVQGVKYRIVPGNPGAKPADYDAAGLSAAKTQAPFTFDFDTTTLVSPVTGDYTLYAVTRDRAGNDMVSGGQKIHVDQDTDKPRVQILGLTAYPSANPATIDSSSGYQVNGVIADDDGVDISSLSLFYSADNVSWTPIPGGITTSMVADPSTKEYLFNFILTKGAAPNLADGVWYLKAAAGDEAGKKNGKPAVEGTTTAIFKIDTVAPVITLDSAFTSGVQTFKAAPALTGTLTEANLATYRVSLDGGAYTDYIVMGSTGLILAGSGPYTWTYKMTDTAFAALEEGAHSVMLEAADQVGRHDTKGWTFFKDNAGPEINFSNITEDGFMIIMDGTTLVHPANTTDLDTLKRNSSIITDNIPRLMGTFTDEYSNIFQGGVNHFYYRFDSGQGSTDSITGWIESTDAMIKTALPSKNVRWEIPLDSSGANLSQGIHWIDIKLADSLGNVNTSVKPGTIAPKYHFERVAFRIDSQPPEVLITSPADNSVFGPPAGASIFTFKADVEDYTLASIDVKVGTYPLYSVNKAGLSGATSKHIEAEFTQTMLGSIGGGGSYAAYPITISAVDDNGRETKLEYRFTMDAAPPLITVSNLNTTKIVSDTYPTRLIEAEPRIQGTVSDDSGLALAQYRIARFTYSGSGTAGSWAAPGAWTNMTTGLSKLETWSIDLKGPTAAGGLALSDGWYRISFKAADKALPTNNSNSTLNDIEFYIDGNSPVLQLVNPKAYYSGRELVQSGIAYIAFDIIAADDNMISGVRGKLDSNVFSSGAITAAAISGAPAGQPNYRLLIPAFNPSSATTALITSGLHTLNLEAMDGSGRTTTITKDFTFDSQKPSVEIIEPGYEAEVTAQVILRGVTSDDNSVKTLSYQLANGAWHLFDRGLNAAGSEVVSGAYTNEDNLLLGKKKDLVQGRGSLYNWTLSFPDIGDLIKLTNSTDYVTALTGGNTGLYELLLKFRVEDSAGNLADYTHTLWVNPEGDRPRVQIDTPDPAATGTDREVGGEVRVFGTATDNDWIYDVAFRVINAASDNGTTAAVVIPGAALHPATNAAAAAKGEAADRRLWYKAAISGVNASHVSWYFTINSSGELNPLPGTNSRPVTIQVIAYDSSQANHNAPKMESQVKNTYATFVNGMPVISNIKITPAGGVAADYTTANPNLGGDFTITATIRDDNGLKNISWHDESSASWTNILASSPSGSPARYARPAAAHLKAPGQITAGRWYFIYEEGASYSGTNTAGQTITATAKGALFKASATAGGSGYAIEAVNSAGGLFTNSPGETAYWEYELSIKENAQTLLGGVEKARNYIYSLQAEDNTSPNPFRAVLDLTLKLDYYHPWGGYTGNGTAAGTGYVLSGEAWDTGSGITVQGIQKIVAWFSRDNQNIPVDEIGGGSYKPGGKIMAKVGRNETSGALGTLTEITLPDLTLGKNDPNLSGIVIDNNEPVNDIDNDGFLEGLVDAGLRMQWYAYLDSTKFKDGMAKVHFVIFDKAGNASYYENNLFFSNHPPKVTSITIATDILGFGSSDDPRGQRTITLNYDKTNITVRNRKLDFKVHIEGQAEPFHYRFGFVSNRPVVNANALVAGEIYAIKEPGNVAWTAVGAPQEFGVNTTFVALGPTNVGTGTAYKLEMGLPRYENTNDKEITFSYQGTDFNTITDTANNDAWFVLKVYNSLRTPIKPDNGASGPAYNNAGPYEVLDQPFDVIRIGVNVANLDITKPRGKLWDLNPKGETLGTASAAAPGGIGGNRDRGGLYNPNNTTKNVVRSGHIEPRFIAAGNANNSSFIEAGRNTNFTRDTVSGKVILRGYAFDEQRIGEVRIRFNDAAETDTANNFVILKADTSSASATKGLLIPAVSAAYVYNDIDLEGHQAEWAYIWDTETLPTATQVGDNIKVQVIVKDLRPAGSAGPNVSDIRRHPALTGETAGVAGTNSDYSRIAVDIHPYISGFERDPNKKLGYNTLRSKQGWYAFSRGETVAMTGFNLKTPSTNSTVTFYTTGADVNAAISGTQTVNRIVFTVPASAVGGYIRLTSGNSAPTVNDANNNLNSWNREDYNPAMPGNELWKDDRSAHIWQSDDDQSSSTNRGYFSQSTRPVDPSMTMDPANGTLWGAWAELSEQALYYNSNASSTRTTIMAYNGGGTMDHTDIHMPYTKRTTNPANPTVFYNSTRSYAGNFNYYDSGGMKGYDPNGGGRYDSAMASSSNGQYNAELVYHNKIIDQFTNPRVVTRGNDIHLTYYDTKDKSIKYWYTKSGMATSGGEYNRTDNRTQSYSYNSVSLTLRGHRWANLDGGFDADDKLGNDRVRQNGLSSSASAGEWSAIDLQKDGKPVVAYYDAEHQTVRIAYASVAVYPLAGPEANQWTVQYAMNAADPNYSFSGQYISMQIDQTNNAAHLAFFKSNSTDLIYLKLNWNSSTNSYSPDGNSVIVDDVGAVGRWVDVSLDQTNQPWISYLDITRTNFYDGVKMAYYDPARFTENVSDSNGVSQKGWETMAVPARYTIVENRTSIETWPGRDTPAGNTTTQFWKAAIGYTNNDYYRIAYYVKPKN